MSKTATEMRASAGARTAGERFLTSRDMDSLGESHRRVTGKTTKLFKVIAWSFHGKDHKHHYSWQSRELGSVIQDPPVLVTLNCLTGLEQQQNKAFGHLLLEVCGIFSQQLQCQNSSVLAQHQHILLLFKSPPWFHLVMLLFAPCPKIVEQFCLFELENVFYLLNCSSKRSVIHARV